MPADRSYDNLYYWDTEIKTKTERGFNRVKDAMNVFPVLRDKYDMQEVLRGVQVTLHGYNTWIRISVYNNVNINPKANPKENKFTDLAHSVYTQEQSFNFPGIYTVNLKNRKPINLKTGTYFGITVQLLDGASEPYPLFSPGGPSISCANGSETNHSQNDLSYVYTMNGEWKRLYQYGNAVARI